MRRLALLLSILIVSCFCSIGLGIQYLKSWSLVDQVAKNAVVVHFPKGTRLQVLGATLEREGLISSSFYFRLWVRINGDYGRYQAGNYQFGPGSESPAKIADKFIKGTSYLPVVLQFTIPEGFNITQIAARLAANGLGRAGDIQKLLQDPKFVRSLKVPAASLEGYLYPATYTYSTMPTLEKTLQDMVETFWQRLPERYLEELKAVGLSLHQAVTFASLIELETLHEDEKAKVSEVIWRRLKAKETISIDASVIYGIKNYKGDITWQHLRDAGNPYNTRIHRGLPPGPIGSPDNKSLGAVLNPSTNGYYFYVLIPDGQTRHHFSTSLSEHNRYVKLLLGSNKSKSAAKGP